MALNTYCFEYITATGDSDIITVPAHDLPEAWVLGMIEVLAHARREGFLLRSFEVSAEWLADASGLVPMRPSATDACDFPGCMERATYGVGVRGVGFVACEDHGDEINALAISHSRKES